LRPSESGLMPKTCDNTSIWMSSWPDPVRVIPIRCSSWGAIWYAMRAVCNFCTKGIFRCFPWMVWRSCSNVGWTELIAKARLKLVNLNLTTSEFEFLLRRYIVIERSHWMVCDLRTVISTIIGWRYSFEKVRS
jgi:hypothetical protein